LDDVPDSLVEALPRVLKVVGAVVAPTTLLTALLFYFGRMHITGMFRYLRVPFSVLDLTVQDYLVRSADGLFVPIAGAAGVVLVGLWVDGFVSRVLPAHSRRTVGRRAAPFLALAGIGLLAVAVVGLTEPAAFEAAPELPGLCLAVGVLLLAWAVRLLRLDVSRPATVVVAQWGAVFAVVAVGLFWGVGNYAVGVGLTRGQQIAQDLPNTPDAVVYSEKTLRLKAPGVTETDCGENADASYRFRYDGLKLVLQSGGQYLFLPAGWTRNEGAAILLPRGDSVRVEFSGPGTARGGGC
jgi:hypothetical protein